MLRSYLRLALFGLGLLVGVQVPGFMRDYAQHVEARRLEAQHALQGFEATARRHFEGDLQALIAHYRSSGDPVFQSDANSLQQVLMRAGLLEGEARAMQGTWFQRLWHLIGMADRQLIRETWRAYGFQVLLAPEAILWGLACAVLLAWLVESLGLLVRRLLAGPRRQTPVRSD